jgi:hypothetical protein
MTKRLLFLSAAMFVVALFASAQEPAAPGSGEPTTNRVSSVRGWVVPLAKTQISLHLKSEGQETQAAQRILSSSSDGSPSTGTAYTETLPGLSLAELKGKDNAVLASESVNMRAGGYYTLLASQNKEGNWSIKTFFDGPAKSGAVDRPLRVLNFADGRETVLEVSGSPSVAVPGNSYLERNSPAKLLGISVKVRPNDGSPPAQSSTEVDFTVLPSAYLFVGPDYRGRMRPRMIDGGKPKYPEMPSTSESP